MNRNLHCNPVIENSIPMDSSDHLLCLDMLHVSWQAGCDVSEDDATLMEIWRSGGLLLASAPIPVASTFRVMTESQPIAAIVVSCENDGEFGFIIQFEVELSQGWFPRLYQPPYLRSKPSENGNMVWPNREQTQRHSPNVLN